MKKIVILHIFPDEKFFEEVADFYDSLPNIDNRYYFFNSDSNYVFKYIKNANRVRRFFILTDYIKELRKKDIDIVLFHSMAGRKFLYANLLRKNVKIIWWAWGFDLYERYGPLSPIIEIDLFKPLTKKFVENKGLRKEKKWTLYFNNSIYKFILSYLRKRAISRVSLFLPCIPIEFDILRKSCPYFKGGMAINPFNLYVNATQKSKNVGNILIGNSLTYTNNHLDVFEHLYNVNLDEGRKYIIPVNYGKGYGGVDNLISASHFRDNQVIWLKDFIPIGEYNNLLNTVSHAIFGVVRQQALGNIYICLLGGAKIFLYKDSMVAQQLKHDGYIFFTIEEDLNEQSLSECLSLDEVLHNYNVYKKSMSSCGTDNVIKQIENLVS